MHTRLIRICLSTESLERIFNRSNGKQFDYVFNCGGETRYSQPDEVYRLRAHDLSLVVGREAAKRKVRAFVECSTGMVYKPSSDPRSESDKTKPWMKLARWKLSAEEELSKIPELNLVVLRFPHVYGSYSSGFIAKALTMARVYKELDKEMKWLWDKDLRVNTVHVTDAARALWQAADWCAAGRQGFPDSMASHSSIPMIKNTPVFNIVDHGSTNQGTLATLINKVFDIPTGFQGTLISNFARLNLDHVVDDLNEEVLQPWADMLTDKGITRPGPLSPFIEKELLKDTDLSMNPARFEKLTGFRYEKTKLTEEEVRGMIESYQRMNWWP